LLHKKPLVIIITDNGKGIDLAKNSYGSGMKNMKHRAASINFDWTVKSSLGYGTEITVAEKV
jgi:signal transduction histidine kinase